MPNACIDTNLWFYALARPAVGEETKHQAAHRLIGEIDQPRREQRLLIYESETYCDLSGVSRCSQLANQLGNSKRNTIGFLNKLWSRLAEKSPLPPFDKGGAA
jgi:hypothetical protein